MIVSLQPATSSDEPYLWHLHKATMQPLVEQVWGWEDDVQRDFFRAYIDRGDLSLIVIDDGRVVGALQYHVEPDHDFLSQVEIAPEHQGNGFGSAVIGNLQAEAARNGKPIRLQVLKVNAAAARLYHRLGFLDTGQTGTHFQMTWIPAPAQ
jgi:ribosomal protein S18 acetylase RimI-like enzyme